MNLTSDVLLNLRPCEARGKELGITLLLVEENVQMALAVSDYAYVLPQGRVDLQVPSEESAQNTHVRGAYLGL